MEKIDTRRLKPEEQFHLRQRIIKLRKQGYPNKEVSAILDVSPEHCSRIWCAYQREGKDAIKLRRRGHQSGDGRVLSREQEVEIRRTIIDKSPDQLKFPWALWTRQAIKELISRRYGIKMPLTTIADYLKRWGFTAQRPTKKAWQARFKTCRKMAGGRISFHQRARVKRMLKSTGVMRPAYKTRPNTSEGMHPRGKRPSFGSKAKKLVSICFPQ